MNRGLYALAGASATATAAACANRLEAPMTKVSKRYFGFSRAVRLTGAGRRRGLRAQRSGSAARAGTGRRGAAPGWSGARWRARRPGAAARTGLALGRLRLPVVVLGLARPGGGVRLRRHGVARSGSRSWKPRAAAAASDRSSWVRGQAPGSGRCCCRAGTRGRRGGPSGRPSSPSGPVPVAVVRRSLLPESRGRRAAGPGSGEPAAAGGRCWRGGGARPRSRRR